MSICHPMEKVFNTKPNVIHVVRRERKKNRIKFKKKTEFIHVPCVCVMLCSSRRVNTFPFVFCFWCSVYGCFTEKNKINTLPPSLSLSLSIFIFTSIYLKFYIFWNVICYLFHLKHFSCTKHFWLFFIFLILV